MRYFLSPHGSCLAGVRRYYRICFASIGEELFATGIPIALDFVIRITPKSRNKTRDHVQNRVDGRIARRTWFYGSRITWP